MTESLQKKRPEERKGIFPARLALVLILLLGAGIRLLYLYYPIMDSDQAITGLMARHILQGGISGIFLRPGILRQHRGLSGFRRVPAARFFPLHPGAVHCPDFPGPDFSGVLAGPGGDEPANRAAGSTAGGLPLSLSGLPFRSGPGRLH